jgi:hypothetical protein
MKHLARWTWVAVLGTALAPSWWSLDAVARRYGMSVVLAGMVSATFGGAVLGYPVAARVLFAAPPRAVSTLENYSTVG